MVDAGLAPAKPNLQHQLSMLLSDVKGNEVMFQHTIIDAHNEISQLLVQPHIAKTFKFAQGKTMFEEEVVVHMQCLIAQAVGDSFHGMGFG